jgi:AAA family ATP:ADP antiporter
MNGNGEALKYLLRKAFDIREGESLRAFLMQLNIFLLISTLLIVKPTVNALFLSRIGVEKLPIVFVLVAIVAVVVVSLYSRLLSRQALGKIVIWTLVTSILALITFGLLLRWNFLDGWILYVCYIFVAIFALLTTSQFWILANLVFNVREAKRLFGFIGAGAIAGGIFGGYLTSILAPLIGSENLFFVCAALLTACIPIVRNVWTRVIDTQTFFQRRKQGALKISEHPLRLIRNSRHLTYMASITGISVVVAKLVDYQYSDIASAAIPDPDDLAAFFGFWYSNLSVVSLLIQLFVTSRIVGFLGVGLALFFLPGGILLGAGLLLFFPELWAAILLKISDGSLKQSINRASMELLALPVPVEIKNQTKTFIDVSVDSIATGIGGLILIFLVSGLELSTSAISLMIIIMIGIWSYFAWRVRKEYAKTYKLRVREAESGPKAKRSVDLTSESVLGSLKKVLENGTDRQICFVLDKIRELNDDRFFEPVRKLIRHDNPAIRAAALHNLYFFNSPRLDEEVETLTTDPDQQVKVRAFEYLIHHSLNDMTEQMDRFLNHPDEKVRRAALVSLARETQHNAALRRAFNLEEHLRRWIARIPQQADEARRLFLKKAALQAIGCAQLADFYFFLEQCMQAAEAPVVRQAIRSAGATQSQEFIDPLLKLAGRPDFKAEALEALANYGKEIIGILSGKVEQPDTPVETVRVVPAVVKHINSQRSIRFLFELFDYEDFVVRLEALRGLNTLKIEFPNLKFHKKEILRRILSEARLYLDTLAALYRQIQLTSGTDVESLSGHGLKQQEARKGLVRLLERRLDGNLERIFRLLGLKYNPEDIIPIYKGIQEKKPDLRINAIEFLDNLLEPNLKKALLPIVETAMLDTLTEDAIWSLNLKIPNEHECFTMLMQGKDTRIKMAVLYLIAQLRDERYLPLVRRFASSRNPKLRDFAEKAQEAMLGAGSRFEEKTDLE